MTYPFTNNLKLNKKEYQKSIYHTKNTKINEYVDKRLVEGFIKNVKGIEFTYHPQKRNYPNELEYLKQYNSLYNFKTNCYTTKLYFPKHKWGRIIPVCALSLSMFHRPTRHALAKDGYIDIDMVNASQNIINEIMKQNDIEVPHIASYCKNRNTYLDFIMKHYECDKKMAKQLIIALSFGGGYDKWIKDNKFGAKDKIEQVINLEADYKVVMGHVWKVNSGMIDDVLAFDPEYFKEYSKNDASLLNAKKRTCMSLFYQTIERHVQEGMINFLVKERLFKLEDIVPCQDGFMIPKARYYEDLIKDIETVQYEKWGFIIPMDVKAFDEAIEIPMADNVDFNKLISEKGIADEIKKVYGNQIMYGNKTFYIFYNQCWKEGEDAEKLINKIISEDITDRLEKYIEATVVSLGEIDMHIRLLRILTRTKSSILHSIKEHLIAITDKPTEPFNNKPFLLGFTNGVLDLKMLQERDADGEIVNTHMECFRPYEYDDFITMNTGYPFEEFDYDDEANKAITEEIVMFFESVMPNKEHLLLLLQELASCLDGLLYQRFIMFNGGGGNGKGTIFEFMSLLLGSYFHKGQNELLKGFGKANQASEDMMDLKGIRMLVFEEIGDEIDNNIMKRLTGGGMLTGRRLFKGNEDFSLNATIFASFNAKPKLKFKPEGNSELRRLIDMFFRRNFTDRDEKVGKVEMKDGIEITWCKADTKFTTKEWGLKIRNGLLHMLLNVYCKYTKGNSGIEFTVPVDVQRRIEEFLCAQNIFNSIFDECYEKVNDDKQFIKLCDVWDNIQLNTDYKELPFKEKRKYNRKYFDEWIEQKANVYEHRHMKVMRGYRIKEEVEYCEEKGNTEVL